MVIVWGSIESLPKKLEELLRLSLEHVHRSRAEPGCISHNVHIDAENDARLIFFEQWESMADLQTHFAVPDSADFVRSASSLAVSPPIMKIFESTQIN
jgi:quinol monooxygenase YgiN